MLVWTVSDRVNTDGVRVVLGGDFSRGTKLRLLLVPVVGVRATIGTCQTMRYGQATIKLPK